MFLSLRPKTKPSPAIAVYVTVLALFAVTPGVSLAQEKGLDVDILLNYYDQDGEHSPVTGGIGTEDLQVIAPVVVLTWTGRDPWTFSADLGVDSISSASTDNIDLGADIDTISSASEQDARGHAMLRATRRYGDQTLRFGVGFSNEYDYTSLSGSIGWSRDFNQRNTTFAVDLAHYADTVELYDIDGELQGDDDRSTTDLALSLTQVLGPRTVGTVELSYATQSGFLSTPFHEVILAPTPDFPEGQHVTERLPDARDRLALGLRVNHTFGKKVVQKLYYRIYDDDFGITAHTVEAETHFRIPLAEEGWIFPILRFHTQEASDYFGLPGSFTGDEPYFTADRDLSEFDSEKFGLGLRLKFARGKTSGFFRRLRSFETRVTSYSRNDGLDALSVSLAFGWSF